ncbi:MAG: leucyl aminopeptidase [Gammaproteobacteria bacterium]|nr:leucyl aminopeptidase [Gammaproteobacteria bacterium]MDH4314943.1 leucyl aminopeptidase [Gammaproteobacteria bacterium]MDH5214176.1 leucyl aminopeptidase [Gammaproteobacteria bacterium]
MEYFTTTSGAARQTGQCVIVGVYENGKLSRGAEDMDVASHGAIRKLLKQGDLCDQLGSSRVLRNIEGVRAQRIVVVGLGDANELGVSQFRYALRSALDSLAGSKIKDIVNFLTLEDIEGSSAYYLARYTVETIHGKLYSFNNLKTGKTVGDIPVKKIGIAVASRSDATKAKLGATHADAISQGMKLARDLGNLPPNVCTPTYLAKTAQKLANSHGGLQTKILNEPEIRKLGMHSFLSVSNGSAEPAKLIVMQYKGGGKDKPVVLVGKGITFDSGGISLKPPPAMDEMKFDMCGAASVIAAIATVAILKLPINVNVVVPTCENLPGGTATRPGDIVESMSGQTIEILNTDAEGRLILCDALTYSRRFKPHTVIDVATLTGACVIALGHYRTAVMSPSDDLAAKITGAGIAADDRCWQMPMGPEYERLLRSNFADMANVGTREGGAITAACFLGKFTKGLNWAHLDIAGTASRSGVRKGATGRPVPVLSEFLLRHAGALP